VETTISPNGSDAGQLENTIPNVSQRRTIEIFSPEKTRLLLGTDVPAEIYQEFVAGIRAIEDGGSMFVPAESEAEMALYKRKLKEIASFRLRFKDEVRRKRDKETKQFVRRDNFCFLAYKPSPKQEGAASGLQKGRGRK
jgi:hypothetical protein